MKPLEGFDLVLNNTCKISKMKTQICAFSHSDFIHSFSVETNEAQYFLSIFAVSCDNIEYLKSICLSVCNLVTIQISPQTPISMENICHFLHQTDGDGDDDDDDIEGI